MKKVIFTWHVHHDVLVEPLLESIQNRIKYIKEFKPKDEIELRLRLLRVVKGELPKEYVEAGKRYCEARRKAIKAYEEGEKFIEAKQKYYKAKWKVAKEKSKEFIKAEKQYCEAGRRAIEAEEKHHEARQKFIEAKEKYYKAYKKHEPEILALHAKECPNCTWNGKIIFNKEGKSH